MKTKHEINTDAAAAAGAAASAAAPGFTTVFTVVSQEAAAEAAPPVAAASVPISFEFSVIFVSILVDIPYPIISYKGWGSDRGRTRIGQGSESGHGCFLKHPQRPYQDGTPFQDEL